jgi:hypothetical protein
VARLSGTIQITNVSTPVVAAIGAARRIHLRSVLVVNQDTVQHTIRILAGAAEIARVSLPASGSTIVTAFDAGSAPDEFGQPLPLNTALNAITLAAPGANTVSVNADYGVL